MQNWSRLKKDGFLQFHSSVSTLGLFILQLTMLWECTHRIPQNCSSWQDQSGRIIPRVSSPSRCTVPLRPSEARPRVLVLTKSEGKRPLMQQLRTNSTYWLKSGIEGASAGSLATRKPNHRGWFIEHLLHLQGQKRGNIDRHTRSLRPHPAWCHP